MKPLSEGVLSEEVQGNVRKWYFYIIHLGLRHACKVVITPITHYCLLGEFNACQ